MKHMLWVFSEEISNEYPQHMLGDEIRKLCQKKVDGNKKKKMVHYKLRKQAYSYILKILPPKNENFQIKIWIVFIFLLKT